MRFLFCFTFLTFFNFSNTKTLNEKYSLSDIDNLIKKINSEQNLWKAGTNFASENSLSKIRRSFGTKRTPPELKKFKKTVNDDDVVIPESFDARLVWPQCPSIGAISDQSACASSWAVGPADVISNRLCIATDGANQAKISAVYIISCCKVCTKGCDDEGWVMMAYAFWCRWGVPTGGAYGTNEGCKNYPFPPCEHYGTEGGANACPDQNYEAPQCTLTCDDANLYLNDTLSVGGDAYFLDWEVESIQTEIMENGPVNADLDVYTDFLTYKSGVYKHHNGHLEGTQTVRLIGWGVEPAEDADSNGTDYWLAANSWNQDWGDGGFFKIIRGKDNCGIESSVCLGIIQTSK